MGHPRSRNFHCKLMTEPPRPVFHFVQPLDKRHGQDSFNAISYQGGPESSRQRKRKYRIGQQISFPWNSDSGFLAHLVTTNTVSVALPAMCQGQDLNSKKGCQEFLQYVTMQLHMILHCCTYGHVWIYSSGLHNFTNQPLILGMKQQY